MLFGAFGCSLYLNQASLRSERHGSRLRLDLDRCGMIWVSVWVCQDRLDEMAPEKMDDGLSKAYALYWASAPSTKRFSYLSRPNSLPKFKPEALKLQFLEEK